MKNNETKWKLEEMHVVSHDDELNNDDTEFSKESNQD